MRLVKKTIRRLNYLFITMEQHTESVLLEISNNIGQGVTGKIINGIIKNLHDEITDSHPYSNKSGMTKFIASSDFFERISKISIGFIKSGLSLDHVAAAVSQAVCMLEMQWMGFIQFEIDLNDDDPTRWVICWEWSLQ